MGKSSNKRDADEYKEIKILPMRAVKPWTQGTDRLYHFCPWRFSNSNWVKPQATCSDHTDDSVLGKRLG